MAARKKSESSSGPTLRGGVKPYGRKKGEKYMKDIAETSVKKLPKYGKELKPEKLDENAEALVLYDPVDEEDVLGDLEGLLDD